MIQASNSCIRESGSGRIRPEVMIYDPAPEDEGALELCVKCVKCGQCFLCGQCSKCVKHTAPSDEQIEVLRERIRQNPEILRDIQERWNIQDLGNVQ